MNLKRCAVRDVVRPDRLTTIVARHRRHLGTPGETGHHLRRTEVRVEALELREGFDTGLRDLVLRLSLSDEHRIVDPPVDVVIDKVLDLVRGSVLRPRLEGLADRGRTRNVSLRRTNTTGTSTATLDRHESWP